MNSHEVAGHVWMSDSDGSAPCDLRFERGENRPTTAKHITETHTDVSPRRRLSHGGREPFGDPLGVAQHTDGRRSLVGRNVHEAFNADSCCRLQNSQRSANISLHRFRGVLLQQ
jgi:hypothetical protein